MKRILFICVNYRTDEMCATLIRQILRVAPSGALDVCVVDNSCRKTPLGVLEGLEGEFKNYRYLKPAQNLGYFGAAQTALSDVGDPVAKYDWVIVSNVDIAIDQADFWTSLLARTEEPLLGVIAPSVYSILMSQESNPFLRLRPTRFRMHFYKWVFSTFLTSRIYHSLALGKAWLNHALSRFRYDRPAGRVMEAYAPHGAIMIFSRDYFRKGGDFRHGAFMYGEEITVAETCRRLGLKVIFDPSLRVTHRERVSTGVVYDRRVLRWKMDSSRFLADTYFP